MALKMDSSNMNQLLLIIIALGLVLDTVYGPTEQQQQYSQKWQYYHHHHEPSSMDDGNSAPRDRSVPREDPASHFTGPTNQTVWMAVVVIVVAYCFWQQNEQLHRLHHAHARLRGQFRMYEAQANFELTECRNQGNRNEEHINNQAEINTLLNANLAAFNERTNQLRSDSEHIIYCLEQASQSQAQQNNQFSGDLAALIQNVKNVKDIQDRFQIELNDRVDELLRIIQQRLDDFVQNQVINNRNNFRNFLLDLARIFVGPVWSTFGLIGNGQDSPPQASHGDHGDQILPSSSTPPPGPQNLPSSVGGGANYGIMASVLRNQIS